MPAVDGNVLRILSRLRMDDRDILDAGVRKAVGEEIKGIMPVSRPGDFNQALMELGATVCIPNGSPRCEECPWNRLCQARIQNRISEYPKKASRKQRSIEKKTILVIRYGRQVALRQRPKRGLLAGLYEFPSLEGIQKEEQVIAYLKELGVMPLRIQKLRDSKHVFTHKE